MCIPTNIDEVPVIKFTIADLKATAEDREIDISGLDENDLVKIGDAFAEGILWEWDVMMKECIENYISAKKELQCP